MPRVCENMVYTKTDEHINGNAVLSIDFPIHMVEFIFNLKG